MKKQIGIKLLLVGLSVSSLSYAQTGEISFTPTGFKFPIMKITLSKNAGSSGTATSATNEQTLYKCSGATEADCLMDLTSQTDLDKITAASKGVSITSGTYDLLSLYSCGEGKGGDSQVSVWVKGSFTVAGTTYYTDATASGGNTSSGSTSAFTEITNWGCATKSVILATPVTIGTAEVALTLLVDNTFFANSVPSTSSGMGGCKAAGGGRGICVNIPALLPYVGADAVTTKRFKLAHNITSTSGITDAKANTVVIVPMAGTTPLTVFAGPYYSETSAATNGNSSAPTDGTNGGPSYNTATDIATFKANSDGTIAFSQGSSGDSYAGVFTAFQLTDHSGSLQTRNGNTWYYKAISF